MNKIQMIKFLEHHGITEIPEGKTLASVIRELPTPSDDVMKIVNESAMYYFIQENKALKETLTNVKKSLDEALRFLERMNKLDIT